MAAARDGMRHSEIN